MRQLGLIFIRDVATSLSVQVTVLRRQRLVILDNVAEINRVSVIAAESPWLLEVCKRIAIWLDVGFDYTTLITGFFV